jgi:hypothetical protein
MTRTSCRTPGWCAVRLAENVAPACGADRAVRQMGSTRKVPRRDCRSCSSPTGITPCSPDSPFFNLDKSSPTIAHAIIELVFADLTDGALTTYSPASSTPTPRSCAREPPTFGALAGEEKLTLAAHDGPGDNLRGCCGHGCLSCRSSVMRRAFNHCGRRLGFDSNTGASAFLQLLVFSGSQSTRLVSCPAPAGWWCEAPGCRSG